MSEPGSSVEGVSCSNRRVWASELGSVIGSSRFFILLRGLHWFSIGGMTILASGLEEDLEGSNSVRKCLEGFVGS